MARGGGRGGRRGGFKASRQSWKPAKPQQESSSGGSESGDEIDSDEAFGSGDEAALRYGEVLDDIAARQRRGSTGNGQLENSDSESSSGEDNGAGGVDDMLAGLRGADSDEEGAQQLSTVAAQRSRGAKAAESDGDSESSSMLSGSSGFSDEVDGVDSDSMLSASSGSDSSDGDDSSSRGSSSERGEGGDDSDDSWLSAGEHNLGRNETEDAAYEHMLEAVSSLRQKGGRGTSASRSNQQADEDIAGGRKRSYDVVRATMDEDVYNVASLSRDKSRLTYGAVAEALGDSARFADVKEQLESLNKRQRTAAPLSEHITEKLERKAGYDAASQAVTTWQRFVQDMRSADNLQFPLHQPSYGVSASSLAAHFEPATDDRGGVTDAMEAKIHSMLVTARLTSAQQQAKTEAMNTLPDVEVTEDEIRRRQAELAKMRHLAFYAEEKNRRKKKIKSKTYRRIQRKAREKQRLTAEELALLDPDAADSADEKRERKRLRERMTLRHSTSTSKFSQHVKQQRLLGNKGTKQAVEAQIRLKDDLKRKMQKLDSESDDSSNSEGELSQTAGTQSTREEPELPKKGLFALSFMRRAQTKENAAAAAAKAAEGDELSHAAMLRAAGGSEKRSDKAPVPELKPAAVASSLLPDEENPWLAHATEEGTSASRSRSLKNQKVESSRRRQNAAKLNDDSDQTSRNTLNGSAGSLTLTPHSKIADVEKLVGDDNASALNDVRRSKFDLSGADAESRALIEAAFAHDDSVQQDFDAEKARIEAEIDAELSGALSGPKQPSEMPGWGTWVGHGTEKLQAAAQRRRQAAKVAEEARTRKSAPVAKFATKRKDSVILQDKRVKAHSKYLLEEVPKPFHTRAQYERTLAVPVGTEWNSRRVHAKRTAPKVSIQPGLPIAPMTAADARQSVSKGHDPKAPSKSKQRRMRQSENKKAHQVARGSA